MKLAWLFLSEVSWFSHFKWLALHFTNIPWVTLANLVVISDALILRYNVESSSESLYLVKRLRDCWAKYGDDWSYWGLKALNHQPPHRAFLLFLGRPAFLPVRWISWGAWKPRAEGPCCFHFRFFNVHNYWHSIWKHYLCGGVLLLFLLDMFCDVQEMGL